jgi:hypothetical protein
MTLPIIPGGVVIPPLMQTVPDRLEVVVGVWAMFLASFDANERRIFEKFEMSGFV